MEDQVALKFRGKKYTWAELPSSLPGPSEYDVAKVLPGPMNEGGMSWVEAQAELSQANLLGESHVKYAEWQLKYGKQGLATNIVVPQMYFSREEDGRGRLATPARSQQVVISHPRDAARIARLHVRKQPNFEFLLYSSIISTTDNDHWKAQRDHLLPAFLPKASLEQVLPVSRARAAACVGRLRDVTDNFSKPVEMNDFFLFETEAQLQLALFGEDEEFMNETNEAFRQGMGGKAKAKVARDVVSQLVDRAKRPTNTCPALPERIQAGECPHVHGPLSNRLASMDADHATEQGNGMIFAFAGHDTTGHTGTWLLFELAKHPDIQRRLQEEVDAFWAAIGDREVTYEDLKRLPFMTRCIAETLRLWPAVANGTFRQIQFDDYITGPNGEDVLLKKGTHVQIANWSRHRNPDLWGPDADQFNPDREFRDSELWHDQVLAAYNPATERFSPFTFPPRGCIGMNFAHMELRLILANLLRNYSFDLTQAYRDMDPSKYLGVNYGTMAPQDLTQPRLVKAIPGFSLPLRVPTGMHLNVVPRNAKL